MFGSTTFPFLYFRSARCLRVCDSSLSPKNVAFNTETWSQNGLRYFVIGDTSVADIENLAKLFKAST